MEQKKNSLYFYVTVIFSLGILAYSAWLILGSVLSYNEGQTESFYYSLILGLIGVALSISSLTTMRRRIQIIKQGKNVEFKVFEVFGVQRQILVLRVGRFLE
jgi:hypothetical protein